MEAARPSKSVFTRLFAAAIEWFNSETSNSRENQHATDRQINPVNFVIGGPRRAIEHQISIYAAERSLTNAVTQFQRNIQEIQTTLPITRKEVNRVVNLFEQNEEYIEGQLLPNSHYEADDFSMLLNNAASVMHRIVDSNPTDNIEPFLNWLSKLRKNCNCLSCGSIAAGPVQLGCPCEKSFCGECISNQFNGQKTIVCPNPDCESPRIYKSDIRFNRDYDENICKAMKQIPNDNQEKQNWEQKRSRYLENRNNTQTEVGSDGLNATVVETPATATKTAIFLDIQDPSKIIDTDEPIDLVKLEENNRKFLFFKQCLVIISFAMLAMLKRNRTAA